MDNNNNNDVIALGKTNFRGQDRTFGIKLDDRRRHIYIIGKSGVGKTELLINMIVQDIQQGNGLAFVDPHGENAERLLDFIPESRIKDVVYFNPADTDYPIAFNVMEEVAPEFRHLVASGMMGVFKKLWPDVWSPRMEYILNNAILALLEVPGSTLLGVNRMFSDVKFREEIVSQLKDPVVKAFWVNEFSRYTDRFAVEATAAIQNKVGQFISNPLVRNVIGQVKSTIDMRKVMDEGKIVVVNVSKGKIGEDSSHLLGALVITKLQLAAMSRVDSPEHLRKDFFLYVDEFQNFATESFATILSEARKYRLGLVLAHQYIAQMTEMVRDAAFGNVGTLISFRVGAEDAEFLEKEFKPEVTAHDLVNLPKWVVYSKLLIDGIASRPFSASTLPPPPKPAYNFREDIIKFSRETYGTPKNAVEKFIQDWSSGEQEQAKIFPAAQSRNNNRFSNSRSFTPKPVLNPAGPNKAELFEILKKQQKHENREESPEQPPVLKPASLKDLAQKRQEQIHKKPFKEQIFSRHDQAKTADRSELRGILNQVLVNQQKMDQEKELPRSAQKPEYVRLSDLPERDEKLVSKHAITEKEQELTDNKNKGVLKPGESVKFDG